MPRLAKVVNVLAISIRQVKQGNETTVFRIGLTLHSCQYVCSWFNIYIIKLNLGQPPHSLGGFLSI